MIILIHLLVIYIIITICIITYKFIKSSLGKTYIISVEGNIGSGKSTLVRKLKKIPYIHVLQEPVDIWKSIADSKGNNILSEFYKNQKRYSYIFQNFAFITRVIELKKLITKVNQNRKLFTNEYIIVERSIYSDYNVFATKLNHDQLLSDLEFKIYKYWFHQLESMIEISAYIYLKVSPSTSSVRVKKRARDEEINAIPIEYLKSLHNYHNKWLSKTNVPLLLIDGNKEFENDMFYYNDLYSQITKFIKKL